MADQTVATPSETPSEQDQAKPCQSCRGTGLSGLKCKCDDAHPLECDTCEGVGSVPTYRRSAVDVLPFNPDRDAARSEALSLLRAVPPYTVESLLERIKVDLAQAIVDFLTQQPEDSIEELVQKLDSIAATAEVASREFRELQRPSDEDGSDRPGFPQ